MPARASEICRGAVALALALVLVPPAQGAAAVTGRTGASCAATLDCTAARSP